MSSIETFVDAVAQDPLTVAAPVAAIVGAVLLYYVVGSRWLGPSADFWSPLRHFLFPLLERVGQRLAPDLNLYATGTQGDREYAATVGLSVDELEVVLHDHGFVKNPWAAVKTAPDGRRSASSMALRQVKRPRLRAVLDAVERLPVAGRVVETVEAMLATRQVHFTLYERSAVDGRSPGDRALQTDVYAHEEPNSVSPLVALAHYRADTWSASRGVEWARSHFGEWGVSYEVLPSKTPSSGGQGSEKKAEQQAGD